MWYPDLSWVGLLRTWETNPHLLLCWCVLSWIVRESSCPHFPLRLGDRVELPGFRELEYLVRKKEHKTTQNTRVEATQTHREMVGYFFFFFLFANKVIFSIFLCRYKMVAMTTVITNTLIKRDLVSMATQLYGCHGNKVIAITILNYSTFGNVKVVMETTSTYTQCPAALCQ